MWQEILQGGGGGNAEPKKIQIVLSGGGALLFTTGIVGDELTHLKETDLGYWNEPHYIFKVPVHVYRYSLTINSPNACTDLGVMQAGEGLTNQSTQYVYVIIEE